MYIRLGVSLLLMLVQSLASGQSGAFQKWTFPVTQSGNTLSYPFAGGVNAPQISRADLNRDGVQDIFIFDRSADLALTLRGLGSGQYIFDPTLVKQLPPLRSWALLRDYNKDGAPDLFASNFDPSDNAIQVYQGYWVGNELNFKPFLFTYPGCVTCENEYIYYPDNDMPGFWNNLIVAETDLPDFTDIDSDGDLDILTFDPSVGGNVLFVRNESVEKGFGDDSLKFVIADECHGQMYESGIERCKCKLSGNPDTCVEFLTGIDEIRHPGSTLMSYDQDGDGDKELVLGDISFDCLNYLYNGGTPQNAWMISQDTAFPSNTVPVELTSFPAAFYLDVDGDGKNDMLAAPNSKTITDDDNSIWYYRNTGSNTNHIFVQQTTNLWQSDMIDIGTTTHPVLIDINQDGLLDLVAGNYGYYTRTNNVGNPNNSSLYLWLNTGTADNPIFSLSSRNWLNFAQFSPDDYDFTPAFGDLDNDGDEDLVVSSNGGILYYCQNTAGANQPMQFTNPLAGYNWQLIDAGTAGSPLIYDLDGDGKKDLLVGERPGNINFYKNTGSATQPIFSNTPTIQQLGAIDTRTFPSTVGYSTPLLITCPGGQTRLLVGNQIGQIEVYSSLAATADSIPKLTENWGNIDAGERSHPAMGDLNNDGIYDLIVGNNRGGFELYHTNLYTSCTTTVTSDPTLEKPSLSIMPNPNDGDFAIKTNLVHGFDWQIINQLGQVIATGASAQSATFVTLPHTVTGIVFVQIRAQGVFATEKILVVRD
jgi:FG-GAP-like repeat